VSDKDQQFISEIFLDEKTVVRRAAHVEHERKVAIYDLLEDNFFHPAGDDGGPYVLHLSIEETTRLVLDIRREDDAPVEKIMLPLKSFQKIVKDYFMICESYFEAIKNAPPSRIEALDMGRRGLHNEGSDILRDRLEGKVNLDRPTARRLFTLVCVLHIR